MSRRQLSTETRCWTTHIFNRCYHNHPPITFMKSGEIIDCIHSEMMEFLFTTGRPIEIKKALGTLCLEKIKISRNTMIIDWIKSRGKEKHIRQLNHHSNGYVWTIKMMLSGRWRLKPFTFKPLQSYNRELAQRIFKKKIQ